MKSEPEFEICRASSRAFSMASASDSPWPAYLMRLRSRPSGTLSQSTTRNAVREEVSELTFDRSSTLDMGRPWNAEPDSNTCGRVRYGSGVYKASAEVV